MERRNNFREILLESTDTSKISTMIHARTRYQGLVSTYDACCAQNIETDSFDVMYGAPSSGTSRAVAPRCHSKISLEKSVQQTRALRLPLILQQLSVWSGPDASG